MLESLHIKNIALISDVTVSLMQGLNILSGETGAGKSIIIDSLNFVLGERADKTLIRYGADVAVVEAVFSDYLNDSVSAYMEDIGLDVEDVLIIRRKMTPDGKNECRINGRAATLGMLKGLTELLVDIHGQHEHQSLLRTSTHIGILDAFGESAVADRKKAVAISYKRQKELEKELNSYGEGAERERRLDVLKFQIEEIKRANLEEDEEDNLLADRKRFRNAEKIKTDLREAYSYLDGGDSRCVLAELNSVRASLAHVGDFDESIGALTARVEAAKAELKDVSETVKDALDALDFDDDALDRLELRLDQIRALKKKYGGDIAAVLKYLSDAEAEYERLDNAAELVAELSIALDKQRTEVAENCRKLTDIRKKTAKRFETAIQNELNDLGMRGSTFSVSFTETLPDANGCDSVEFLISPNAGEPLKPLAKIISGGEMSRFMLALKNIVAGLDNISTMVFDEIDTGISGHIAQVVAEKLYNISAERQVIAVTHLPQLASMADQHYLIKKDVEDGKTNTHLLLLDDEGTLGEIARLIGGSDYSGFAIPHAREMKQFADAYKKKF